MKKQLIHQLVASNVSAQPPISADPFVKGYQHPSFQSDLFGFAPREAGEARHDAELQSTWR